jgi:hypothetical protein
VSRTLVELEGQPDDLAALASLSSSTWAVVRVEAAYSLTSDAWEAVDELTEVLDSAKDVLDALNGAAAVYILNFEPVRLSGQVHRETDDGKKLNATIQTITGRGKIRHSPQITTNTPDLGAWMTVVEAQASVRKALTLYGGLEPTWRNLYLVLEVIEDSVGGEKALLSGSWCPDSTKIKRFKAIANNWKALGVHARHATERFGQPAATMTLQEAMEVIRAVLAAWLGTFLNRLSLAVAQTLKYEFELT